MSMHEPSYISRLTPGEIDDRAGELRERMDMCVLCPRECGARRYRGRIGVCRSTGTAAISGAAPHFGEEPPLVGRHGSGTIFFSSCNLKCLFCQNADISHGRSGHAVTEDQLAGIMLGLQRAGCHNINLVTPTHFTPQIAGAVAIAARIGLRIPLVYNCGGYESTTTLRLLDGIVDIYMPDVKYSRNDSARKYSGAKDYWEVVKPALREMQRQVGDLECDGDGVARRGLLIRHLVLPGNLAGTGAVMDFIAGEISRNAYVNIMDQYRPCHMATRITGLDRRPTPREYADAVACAGRAGLKRGF